MVDFGWQESRSVCREKSPRFSLAVASGWKIRKCSFRFGTISHDECCPKQFTARSFTLHFSPTDSIIVNYFPKDTIVIAMTHPSNFCVGHLDIVMLWFHFFFVCVFDCVNVAEEFTILIYLRLRFSIWCFPFQNAFIRELHLRGIPPIRLFVLLLPRFCTWKLGHPEMGNCCQWTYSSVSYSRIFASVRHAANRVCGTLRHP